MHTLDSSLNSTTAITVLIVDPDSERAAALGMGLRKAQSAFRLEQSARLPPLEAWPPVDAALIAAELLHGMAEAIFTRLAAVGIAGLALIRPGQESDAAALLRAGAHSCLFGAGDETHYGAYAAQSVMQAVAWQREMTQHQAAADSAAVLLRERMEAEQQIASVSAILLASGPEQAEANEGFHTVLLAPHLPGSLSHFQNGRMSEILFNRPR